MLLRRNDWKSRRLNCSGQWRASGAERWTERQWAGRKRKCGRQERNLKSYCSGGEEAERAEDTDRPTTGALKHGRELSHGEGRTPNTDICTAWTSYQWELEINSRGSEVSGICWWLMSWSLIYMHRHVTWEAASFSLDRFLVFFT